MKKILIQMDMEGICNVASWRKDTASGTESPYARKWYTESANAAIKACKEAGFNVVLADCHGTGDNFNIDDLDQDIELINSWPRRPGDVIDKDVVACILLGYHVRGSTTGVLSHTICSPIMQIKINEKIVSESSIAALVCGYFDIPIIMASGDLALKEQLKEEFGFQIPFSVTKTSLSRTCNKSIMPQKSYEDIYKTASHALTKINDTEILQEKGKIKLEMSLYEERTSERILFLPWVKLINDDKPGRTIRVNFDNILQAADFTEFVSGCIVN